MAGCPTLLILIDGVGDRPLARLQNRTPLQAANLPALDSLARLGCSGLADPVRPGITASTIQGTLGVLGYDPLEYPIGRGVVEAVGCSLAMSEGDVAVRGNWAWMDEAGYVRDRRAGRIRDTSQLVRALEKIHLPSPYRFRIGTGTEHRLALVLSGPDLSERFTCSDPTDHDPNGYRKTPTALNRNNQAAVLTARLLDDFELQAREILLAHPLNNQRVALGLAPANAILTRGPGQYITLPPFSLNGQEARGLCIAADKTIIGLASMVRMRTLTTGKMTANLDTDLREKFSHALENLTGYDLVLLHIKGCDIASHNRDYARKRDFLEAIDRELSRFLQTWNREIRIGVTGDHSTSSEMGYHCEDPVPTLLYDPNLKPDTVEAFDEVQARSGSLNRFPLYRFLDYLQKN